MTNRAAETSPLKAARLAGLLYLVVVPLGIFSLSVSSSLVVPGNIAATTANILNSETLYRFGIVSDMLATLVMLAVAFVLYGLFKPVNKNIAAVMVLLVVIGASISMTAHINTFAALHTLGAPDYLKVFTTEQLQALANYSLRVSGFASKIAFIFWGLWLLPLGYLVFKSGFLPKLIGIVLVISSVGYVINSVAFFLDYSLGFGMVWALGELIFILWLLAKGVNVEQWNRRALESA